MTHVLQSVGPRAPAWVQRCVASVRAWAAASGFDYSLVGDADLFAGAPPSLPGSDLGRLLLLRRALDAGAGRAVWVDADVVVFDPSVLSVAGDVGVCREVWVTGGPRGSLRTLDLVCNAVLAVSDAERLDRLIDESRRRLTPAVHARALGPDLFTALHRVQPFTVLDGWGLFSPAVVRDVARGGGPALDVHAAAQPVLGAVNLCASMADDDAVWDAAVAQLMASRSWPLALKTSLHASQTGRFFGSRDGTNTAPHSASSGVPIT